MVVSVERVDRNDEEELAKYRALGIALCDFG